MAVDTAMKFNKTKTLTAAALLSIAVGCTYVLFGMMGQASYVYPTPETQSAFLKNYTPEGVAARFASTKYSFHESMGGGPSEAGREFATHERNFERYFVIQAKDWMPLMTALREDVSSQLVSQGIQIPDQTGDPRDGFQFQYNSGKTLGTVNVEPLKMVAPEDAIGHLTSGRPNTICEGEAAVKLRVSLQEKYFKHEPGLITVKLTADPT
jgi:hypothetical protein